MLGGAERPDDGIVLAIEHRADETQDGRLSARLPVGESTAEAGPVHQVVRDLEKRQAIPQARFERLELVGIDVELQRGSLKQQLGGADRGRADRSLMGRPGPSRSAEVPAETALKPR
jgi:hypothetical protein